jgi:hypothetical protein
MNPSVTPLLHPSVLSTMFMETTTPSSVSSGSTSSTMPTPQGSHFSLDSDHLNPPPVVPSTFLPSYYPNSRDRLPALPSQRQNQRTISRSAADVDRVSASGPSHRHLLDGVAMSSPPRPAQPSASTPIYDLSPAAYNLTIPAFDSGPAKRRSGLQPADPYVGSPGEGGGGSGTAAGGPYSSGLIPKLSSTSLSNYAQGVSSQSRAEQSQSRYPSTYTDSYPGSYTPATAALSDPTPNSVNYPGTMFGNLGLPESVLAPPPPWNPDVAKVTGEDYSKVSCPTQIINNVLIPGTGDIWTSPGCYSSHPTHLITQ